MSGTAALALAEQLEPLLMGTQCTQCGYPSCRAYAEALAEKMVAPNRCRPGGVPVWRELQKMLAPSEPLVGELYQPPLPPQLAQVIEADCIGCTLCAVACPTAAIIGAAKQLHTVLASDCTGCGLCLPVCPVDCITLIPAPAATGLLAHDAADVVPVRQKTWQRIRAKQRRESRLDAASRKVSKDDARQPLPLAETALVLSAAGGLPDKIRRARELARARHQHLLSTESDKGER